MATTMRGSKRLMNIALLLLALSSCVTANEGGRATIDPRGDHWRNAPAAASPRAQAYAHYLAGLVLERQGRYDESLAEMARVMELDKDAATPALRLIRAYVRREEYEKALALAERALKQQPDRANLWVVSGEIYHRLRRFDEAIHAFSKAIELNPDNLLSYGALVEIQETTNDLVAAIDIYHKLIELSPDSAGLHYQLGINLARIKDAQGAMAALARAVELNPNLLRAQYLLGTLCLEEGRNEDAVDMLTRYLSRRPADTEAMENMAGALMRLGRSEEALNLLRKILAGQDAAPEHHIEAMYVLLRSGDGAGAERMAPPAGAPFFGTLMTAIARRAQGLPHAPLVESLEGLSATAGDECGLHISALFYHFGNEAAGTWLLGELAALRGGVSHVRALDYVEGRTLMLLERYAEAAALWERMLATYPRDKEYHYFLAVCYEELDDFEGTERNLLAYLELNPEDPEVQNFLGYLYAEHNVKLDKAESLLKKALAADPENPFYLDSLGWIYYRRGKAQEAIDLIKRAIYGMESDDAVLRDHLGDAYLLLGDVERAIAEWERARRLDRKLEGVQEKIDRHRKQKET